MRIRMLRNQRVCVCVYVCVFSTCNTCVHIYIHIYALRVRARIRAYACLLAYVWSVNGGSSHLKGVL